MVGAMHRCALFISIRTTNLQGAFQDNVFDRMIDKSATPYSGLRIPHSSLFHF